MTLGVKLKAGFSLFEMAIALTILSILIASVVTLIPVKQEQENIDEINAKLTRIQQALDSFYNQNGYLPCPAPLNANFSDVGTQIGKSQDCTGSVPGGITEYAAPGGNVWIGAIPTRTLNLPDDMMFDPWNRRIEYGVVQALAQSKTNYSGLTSTGSFFIIRDSLLSQINTDSTSGSDPKAVNIVAYTLFSHGKDGNGATNTSGTTQTCSSSSLDNENCNNDNIFIDASLNSSSGPSYYDDYVRWKSNQQQNRDGTLGGGSGNGVGSTAGNSYSLVGIFVHQISSTSDAGTCPATTWTQRPINTTVVNNLVSASLGSNQITLGAGTYFIRASGPAYNVGANLIRIQQTSPSASTLAYGDVVDSSSTASTSSASAAVTFTTTTTIEIDHYCSTAQTTNGLGNHGGLANGTIYNTTQVEIWQKL